MEKVSFEIIITIFFSVIGFGKWIYEYTKNKQWERTKFLSEKIDIFFSDEKIMKVLQILDWNSGTIEVEGKRIKYNDDMIMESLMTHNMKHFYIEEEKCVRDLFDYFFDKLSQFQIWIDTGLINEKHTKRFLKYYLEIISGKRNSKSKSYVDCLNKYIHFYGYDIKIIENEK